MKHLFLLLLSVNLLLVGCKSSEVDELEMNKYVNEWLFDNMSALYYWNSSLPAYRTSTESPTVYFESLLNKDDRFSAIFESYQDILNSLNGISASDIGFEFQLHRESDANENVIGVVLYAKPGTPATVMGIKRGDMFRKINGQQLTITNYSAVINSFFDNSTSVSLTFSDRGNEVLTDKLPVTVAKVNNYKENPVLLDSVYTIQNKKIGYIIYNFFTNDAGDNSMQYDLALNSAFGRFKESNITELIVDLRYNHGGMMSSAVSLASMLVPNLAADKVFSYTEYNQNYTNYFKSDSFKKEYPNENPFVDNFATTINLPSPKTDKIPIQNVGNGLQRIYFLTGKGTASASEMVINGLKPFLPCVLIGDTTVGKNVGSTLVNDEDNTKNQWAFMPIILRYFNKDRQSDFTLGFVPDFIVKDDYKHQLGDTQEALLAKAIGQISGVQNTAAIQTPALRTPIGLPINVKSVRHDLVVRKKSIDAYLHQYK